MKRDEFWLGWFIGLSIGVLAMSLVAILLMTRGM